MTARRAENPSLGSVSAIILRVYRTGYSQPTVRPEAPGSARRALPGPRSTDAIRPWVQPIRWLCSFASVVARASRPLLSMQSSCSVSADLRRIRPTYGNVRFKEPRRLSPSIHGACPNVICLSPFPCLNQATTGNSGQSLPPRYCVSSEASATVGQISDSLDAPRTRERHRNPGAWRVPLCVSIQVEARHGGG